MKKYRNVKLETNEVDLISEALNYYANSPSLSDKTKSVATELSKCFNKRIKIITK